MRPFASKTPYSLPEHFVCLPLIGIQFVSEISKDGILDFFTVSAGDLLTSTYRECKEESALLQSHVGYFLCSNSIFNLMVPPRVTFLPLFAIPSRFRPHSRAEDETTVALNSGHSISALTLHSGSSRSKDDTLSAKVFLKSLSARASHFIRKDLLVLHICVGPEGFPGCKLQTSK